jgi:hypothetical protein|tara:strand:+ start:666 stop:1640 length:975 start_codon:yes stop_codon:yes gene_type:complete
MSFANLKKQSSLGSLTQKLVKEVEKMNSNSSGGDDRLWKPEMDKTGNGYAVIRFLPAPDGEDLPWVKMYSHGFQGPGGWYIENSLTTIGQKDPVSEYNRTLWNSGNDKDKEIVRKQKRKLSYYANIYVVKDPANPANDGNVFLFKFGKKIFDKIMAAMQPEFEDETPINPFDFWQGANFKLKIRKVDGYWNYDKSEFDSPSALLDDDDALEALWKTQHSLAAMTAADQFKTYEQLQTRLDYVLGRKGTPRLQDEEVQNEDNMRGNFSPSFGNRQQESELPADLKQELDNLGPRSDFNAPDITPKASSDDGDDDALSYFQRLAES